MGFALALPVLALALAGCRAPRLYDGRLADGLSRLTVENRTPWRREIHIEARPAQPSRHDPPCEIHATLNHGRSHTWGLAPDRYLLLVQTRTQPVHHFSKTHDAPPDAHAFWPLYPRTGPGTPQLAATG
jgi:hypothetical protein